MSYRRKTRDSVLVEAVIGLAVLVVIFVQVAGPVAVAVLVLAAAITGSGFLAFKFCRPEPTKTATNLASPLQVSEPSVRFKPFPDHRVTGADSSQSDLRPLSEIDWYQFEQVVALVYRKRGFGVERRGGANPDGGIDIVLTNPGGERIAVQCKQWKTWNIGVKVVREFFGALKLAGIERGILVTLHGYTAAARSLAQSCHIELLDEAEFWRLFEATDAKYDPNLLAIFNDKRKFCPKCGSEMVLRTATRGSKTGGQFWGCSSYPLCRFTIDCAKRVT